MIELRHPDWEMDGCPLAVWMDWYERDGEPQSRYRIVFHENPEISEELRKKLEALSLKVDEALPKKQKEKRDEVFVGLANYISQVNLSVIPNHQ